MLVLNFQDRWKQKETLKKQGFIKCPLCEGFGELWNRFTYSRTICPLCQGHEVVRPASDGRVELPGSGVGK